MSDDQQIMNRWQKIAHKHRTDEQIRKCLSQIETLLWGPGSAADLYEIPERILFIAREMPNWHMYRVIEWIISTNGEDDTAVFQQVIYHMISCLDVNTDPPLIETLFGKNDEFFIDSECLFTKEVSDLAYELMFDEHLAARERRELYDEEHIKGRERTELEYYEEEWDGQRQEEEDYDEERDEWWNGQQQEEESEMME